MQAHQHTPCVSNRGVGRAALCYAWVKDIDLVSLVRQPCRHGRPHHNQTRPDTTRHDQTRPDTARYEVAKDQIRPDTRPPRTRDEIATGMALCRDRWPSPSATSSWRACHHVDDNQTQDQTRDRRASHTETECVASCRLTGHLHQRAARRVVLKDTVVQRLLDPVVEVYHRPAAFTFASSSMSHKGN